MGVAQAGVWTEGREGAEFRFDNFQILARSIVRFCIWNKNGRSIRRIWEKQIQSYEDVIR